MSLEEAIKHCNEIISTCSKEGCKIDHIQLKDWLLELKELREKVYGVPIKVKDLADWAVKTIKPNLNKIGDERIRVRANVIATLSRNGYYDPTFSGRRIIDISPECAEFLDMTKDPE